MSIATRIQAMEEHISNAYDSLNKLGVTADNKNIENIAGLINEIYNNSPKTDYASGTNLTLENTRIGKIDFKDTDNIEKIGFGATNQDGEPTPDSPQDINVVSGYNVVGISNKNVLPNLIQSQTLNGITITRNSDGTLLINGTATANTYFDFSTDFDTTKYAGYKFYGFPDNPGFFIRISKSDRVALQDISSNGTVISNNGIGNYIAIRIASGANVNNRLLSPMIIAPTETDTTYIEHQEQSYEINLLGKNLANIDDIQLQKNWQNAIDITRASILNIPVKPSTTYTLSSSYTSSSITNIRCILFEAIGDVIHKGVVSGTFTTTSTTHYLSIEVLTNTTFTHSVLDGLKIQLEQNNMATPYEPYFIPIKLCKIDTYQDYIYKNNDNWYLHKEIGKITWNGTETWAANITWDNQVSNETMHFYSVINNWLIGQTNYKSDKFIGTIQTTRNLNNEEMTCNTSTNVPYIFVKASRIGATSQSTEEERISLFKTWLTNNHVNVYYALATPTETQITDENLIAQLNAWYNAQSMDDTTYIIVNGDLPMQLKLKALKK